MMCVRARVRMRVCVCVCVSYSVALELLYEHGCDYLIEHGQLTCSSTALPFLAAINSQ